MTSNLAPVLKRLRIDVDDVRAANPDIIYVRGTGWGNEGPMAGVGGYDMAVDGRRRHGLQDDKGRNRTAAATAGVLRPAGANRSPAPSGSRCSSGPPRARPPWSTSHSCTSVCGLWPPTSWARRTRATSRPTAIAGNRPNPLVNGYATKDDRWVYFVCLQPDRFWAEFCTLLERPDLIGDPRYVDSKARYEHRTELVEELDSSSTT